MTNPTSITCEQFADVLADFLERDVDERTRGAVEAHALACAECGSLLADLRKLRVEAASLPALAPSRDLWAGIEARIATPVVDIGHGPTAARRRRAWPWGAAAAAVLMLATASITHVLTRRAYRPPTVASGTVGSHTERSNGTTGASPARQTAVDSASSAESNMGAPGASRNASSGASPRGTAPQRLGSAKTQLVSHASPDAEQVYDGEIARLRAIVRERRAQLDPTTLAVIEKNLAVIDTAITQCKAALRRDPASRFLIQSLDNALGTKVELLRTAAMLPARTL